MRRALCALLLALLAGCSSAGSTVARYSLGFEVQLRIAPDANQNYPIAISLLLVYRASLAEELMKLSADEWFAQRDDYLRNHAGQIEEQLWEFAPGQRVAPLLYPHPHDLAQGILFIKYRTPGLHRHPFDPRHSQRLYLGAQKVVLTPID